MTWNDTYFPLYRFIFRELHLSGNDAVIYAFLFSQARYGEAHLSLTSVAQEVNSHASTCIRSMQRLYEAGHIVLRWDNPNKKNLFHVAVLRSQNACKMLANCSQNASDNIEIKYNKEIKNKEVVKESSQGSPQHHQQAIVLDLPSWADALAYAQQKNVSSDVLRKWWLDRSAAGWLDRHERTIKNWQADLMRYAGRERPTNANNGHRAPINRPPMLTEAERQEMREAELRKKDPEYLQLVDSVCRRFGLAE